MTTDPNPHHLERVSIESIVNMFMKIFNFGSAQVCMVHVNVPRHMLTQIRTPIITNLCMLQVSSEGTDARAPGGIDRYFEPLFGTSNRVPSTSSIYFTLVHVEDQKL